jgi:hypothetical protein
MESLGLHQKQLIPSDHLNYPLKQHQRHTTSLFNIHISPNPNSLLPGATTTTTHLTYKPLPQKQLPKTSTIKRLRKKQHLEVRMPEITDSSTKMMFDFSNPSTMLPSRKSSPPSIGKRTKSSYARSSGLMGMGSRRGNSRKSKTRSTMNLIVSPS